ncbi:MAG: hypothetical protein ABJG42_24295 [Vibrio splendidus]
MKKRNIAALVLISLSAITGYKWLHDSRVEKKAEIETEIETKTAVDNEAWKAFLDSRTDSEIRTYLMTCRQELEKKASSVSDFAVHIVDQYSPSIFVDAAGPENLKPELERVDYFRVSPMDSTRYYVITVKDSLTGHARVGKRGFCTLDFHHTDVLTTYFVSLYGAKYIN